MNTSVRIRKKDFFHIWEYFFTFLSCFHISFTFKNIRKYFQADLAYLPDYPVFPRFFNWERFKTSISYDKTYDLALLF